ncbi:MAG: hypothetical protein FHP92_14715 [Denitromonas halophila]|nr:MAG: hypothetical protein FHP92_14715 [Denitromonas halophila]
MAKLYDAPDFSKKIHAARVSRFRKLLANPMQLRESDNYNQSDYWRLYGVSQSAGSRMENGRPLSGSTQILIVLKALGRISDEDLIDAVRLVEEVGLPRRGQADESID